MNTPYQKAINAKLSEIGITLFGVADLKVIPTLPDKDGNRFPRAVSFARRMDPLIMAAIKERELRSVPQSPQLRHLRSRLSFWALIQPFIEFA